jgi:hypothetical protein
MSPSAVTVPPAHAFFWVANQGLVVKGDDGNHDPKVK